MLYKKKYIFSSIMAILLLATIPSCAATEPEPAARALNLAGYSSDLKPDAQRLYAQARILWNDAEKCSDPTKAIEYLDVVIKLEPDYADAYIRRALALSDLSEWNEAVSDASKAIRLAQKPDHYALRSLIFMREGNYKGARKDLERALKLDSANIRAREYLKDLNKLETANFINL